MITFIAHTRVKAENAAAYEALLAEVRARTLEHEPGVAYYEFSRSVADPEVFVVVEAYADAATHAAHMASDWVRASLPKAIPLMEGKPDIKQYVSGGSEPVRAPSVF